MPIESSLHRTARICTIPHISERAYTADKAARRNHADMINTRIPVSMCIRSATVDSTSVSLRCKRNNYKLHFQKLMGGVVAPEAGGERGTQSVMQLLAAEMSAQLPDSVFLMINMSLQALNR